MKKNKQKTEKEYCPNEKCPEYGSVGIGNIILYGKNRNGRQTLKCKKCGHYFCETRGTIFYNKKRLKESEIILICKLLVEKNSIRSIERITEHHRDTIGNLINDMALHTKQVNDFLLREVKMTDVQLDEFWTYIKKNKKNLSREMLRNLEIVTHT
jgi:transposase-like protein